MKYAWISLSLAALASVASAEGVSKAVKPPSSGSGAPTPQLVTTFVGGADTCTTPDVIAGLGPHAWDTTTSTTGFEGQNESLCLYVGTTAIDNDVWFSWTSPSSGTASLDICTSGGTALDTKVAVYNGSGCPTGAAIGCNDDACVGLQSIVTFPVTSGNTYSIQLGSYPGAGTGTGTFTISISPAPSNDACATPVVITGTGPVFYDTTYATTGTQGQNYTRCHIFNTRVISFDIWYTWTAPSSGWVSVDLCAGGAHDTKAAVYAGAGCPVAEPIICDDDSCGTLGGNSLAAFNAVAGNTYTFQIGSYNNQAGTQGSFTISPFTPAAGDDCAAPINISGNGPFAWDNTFGVTGTAGQNQALCDSQMITNDLWYRWTSYCTSAVTVTACNQSQTDTKIAVYQASACPGFAPLACNDDFCAAGGPSQVTFSGTTGVTYMIQIGCWPGEVPGSGTFSISTGCQPGVGTLFCLGDGVAPTTACPCGNHSATVDGAGCLSSLGMGGRLRATGNPSITDDGDGSSSVTLIGSQMPNSSCLYFQGTVRHNSGNGATFGDGLRCAGGSIIRLDTEANMGGTSQYPNPTQTSPITVRGNVVAPGTRTYQAWYRNAAAFCTPATFNLSNGLEIAWGL